MYILSILLSRNKEPKIIVKKTIEEEQTQPLEHDKEYKKKVLRGMHKSNALYMKRFNKINKLSSPVWERFTKKNIMSSKLKFLLNKLRNQPEFRHQQYMPKLHTCDMRRASTGFDPKMVMASSTDFSVKIRHTRNSLQQPFQSL